MVGYHLWSYLIKGIAKTHSMKVWKIIIFFLGIKNKIVLLYTLQIMFLPQSLESCLLPLPHSPPNLAKNVQGNHQGQVLWWVTSKKKLSWPLPDNMMCLSFHSLLVCFAWDGIKNPIHVLDPLRGIKVSVKSRSDLLHLILTLSHEPIHKLQRLNLAFHMPYDRSEMEEIGILNLADAFAHGITSR